MFEIILSNNASKVYNSVDEKTVKRLTNAFETISQNPCNFYINRDRFSDEFMVIDNLVIDNLSDEVIIGAATMQKWRI